MQFLDYKDIPESQIVKTFKNASWRSLMWVVVIMATITAYTAIPKGGPTNPILIAVPGFGTLFFFGLCLWYLWLNKNPRNWLVKASKHGLYINLQSNLDIPPMAEVPDALFIAAESVEHIHRVHELRVLPDRHGKYKNTFLYFDITLREGMNETLLVALARIRRNPALRGSMGIRKDLPGQVRVKDQFTIRLFWDWMSPRELAAEAWFTQHYSIAEKEQFTGPGWATMSSQAQDEYIDNLWEWGNVQDAVLQKSIKETISERAAARALAERLG